MFQNPLFFFFFVCMYSRARYAFNRIDKSFRLSTPQRWTFRSSSSLLSSFFLWFFFRSVSSLDSNPEIELIEWKNLLIRIVLESSLSEPLANQVNQIKGSVKKKIKKYKLLCLIEKMFTLIVPEIVKHYNVIFFFLFQHYVNVIMF